MVSISNIPIDIIHLVAEQLTTQGSSPGEIKRHLAACRLTCRLFAQIFEPYLFRNGVFADNSVYDGRRSACRAWKLLQAIKNRPELANHVRNFTLSLSMPSAPPYIPAILEHMGKLERLEVNGKGSAEGEIDWMDLEAPLRTVLTKLVVDGECLRELAFEQIASIPSALVLGAPHLTKISLRAGSIQDEGDAEPETSLSSDASEHEPFAFDISFSNTRSVSGWLSTLPSPHPFLGKMRYLKVTHNAEEEPHLNEILRICGRNGSCLEVLDITFHPKVGCELFLCRYLL